MFPFDDVIMGLLFVYPNSKVHVANLGPTWGRQGSGGPHVGHTNLEIWVSILGRGQRVDHYGQRASGFQTQRAGNESLTLSTYPWRLNKVHLDC